MQKQLTIRKKRDKDVGDRCGEKAGSLVMKMKTCVKYQLSLSKLTGRYGNAALIIYVHQTF